MEMAYSSFGCFQYQQQSACLVNYVNLPMCFPQIPRSAVAQNMEMAPGFGCFESQHQPVLYANPPMCFPQNPYGGIQELSIQSQWQPEGEEGSKAGGFQSYRSVLHQTMYPILRNLGQVKQMPIVQVNGQRITGPPYGYMGPGPVQGSEVFVKNLPRTVLEPELMSLFEGVGRIYKLRLMMNFSGSNRGFCFVQFFTPAEATAVIESFRGFEIRHRHRIIVRRSLDNRTLRMTGLLGGLSEAEIGAELIGTTHGVTRVHLGGYDPNGARTLTVIYESHEAAGMALRTCLTPGFGISGIPVHVAWSRPRSKRTKESKRQRQRMRQDQIPADSSRRDS